jgi:hypothetical protein
LREREIGKVSCVRLIVGHATPLNDLTSRSINPAPAANTKRCQTAPHLRFTRLASA